MRDLTSFTNNLVDSTKEFFSPCAKSPVDSAKKLFWAIHGNHNSPDSFQLGYLDVLIVPLVLSCLGHGLFEFYKYVLTTYPEATPWSKIALGCAVVLSLPFFVSFLANVLTRFCVSVALTGLLSLFVILPIYGGNQLSKCSLFPTVRSVNWQDMIKQAVFA